MVTCLPASRCAPFHVQLLTPGLLPCPPAAHAHSVHGVVRGEPALRLAGTAAGTALAANVTGELGDGGQEYAATQSRSVL